MIDKQTGLHLGSIEEVTRLLRRELINTINEAVNLNGIKVDCKPYSLPAMDLPDELKVNDEPLPCKLIVNFDKDKRDRWSSVRVSSDGIVGYFPEWVNPHPSLFVPKGEQVISKFVNDKRNNNE